MVSTQHDDSYGPTSFCIKYTQFTHTPFTLQYSDILQKKIDSVSHGGRRKIDSVSHGHRR
jgi:hypothetical protein